MLSTDTNILITMRTFPRVIQSKLYKYFQYKDISVKPTKPWRSVEAKEKHLRLLMGSFDVSQKMGPGPFAMSNSHANEFVSALAEPRLTEQTLHKSAA